MFNSEKTNDEPKQYKAATDVYGWGNDSHGQLGIGNYDLGRNFLELQSCDFSIKIDQLSCGESHAAFISGGFIYAMGDNTDGRLGISKREIKHTNTPCLVQALTKYQSVRVSCGARHTAAVISSGELFAWGYGGNGQLGLGNNLSQYSPQLVQLNSGEFYTQPHEKIPSKDVSCGSNFTGVITVNGEVYMFGKGDFGQLGNGKKDAEFYPAKLKLANEKIEKISCGNNHTLILTASRRVYAFGMNDQGQLGIGNKKATGGPFRVSSLDNIDVTGVSAGYHSAAITFKGDIYIWGPTPVDEYLIPQPVQKKDDNMLVDLKQGDRFSLILDVQGALWGLGNNSCGQLYQGDTDPHKGVLKLKLPKNKRIRTFGCGKNYVIGLGPDRMVVDNQSMILKDNDKSGFQSKEGSPQVAAFETNTQEDAREVQFEESPEMEAEQTKKSGKKKAAIEANGNGLDTSLNEIQNSEEVPAEQSKTTKSPDAKKKVADAKSPEKKSSKSPAAADVTSPDKAKKATTTTKKDSKTPETKEEKKEDKLATTGAAKSPVKTTKTDDKTPATKKADTTKTEEKASTGKKADDKSPAPKDAKATDSTKKPGTAPVKSPEEKKAATPKVGDAKSPEEKKTSTTKAATSAKDSAKESAKTKATPEMDKLVLPDPSSGKVSPFEVDDNSKSIKNATADFGKKEAKPSDKKVEATKAGLKDAAAPKAAADKKDLKSPEKPGTAKQETKPAKEEEKSVKKDSKPKDAKESSKILDELDKAEPKAAKTEKPGTASVKSPEKKPGTAAAKGEEKKEEKKDEKKKEETKTVKGATSSTPDLKTKKKDEDDPSVGGGGSGAAKKAGEKAGTTTASTTAAKKTDAGKTGTTDASKTKKADAGTTQVEGEKSKKNDKTEKLKILTSNKKEEIPNDLVGSKKKSTESSKSFELHEYEVPKEPDQRVQKEGLSPTQEDRKKYKDNNPFNSVPQSQGQIVSGGDSLKSSFSGYYVTLGKGEGEKALEEQELYASQEDLDSTKKLTKTKQSSKSSATTKKKVATSPTEVRDDDSFMTADMEKLLTELDDLKNENKDLKQKINNKDDGILDLEKKILNMEKKKKQNEKNPENEKQMMLEQILEEISKREEELENLRRALQENKDEMEDMTKENEHLEGLFNKYGPGFIQIENDALRELTKNVLQLRYLDRSGPHSNKETKKKLEEKVSSMMDEFNIQTKQKKRPNDENKDNSMNISRDAIVQNASFVKKKTFLKKAEEPTSERQTPTSFLKEGSVDISVVEELKAGRKKKVAIFVRNLSGGSSFGEKGGLSHSESVSSLKDANGIMPNPTQIAELVKNMRRASNASTNYSIQGDKKKTLAPNGSCSSLSDLGSMDSTYCQTRDSLNKVLPIRAKPLNQNEIQVESPKAILSKPNPFITQSLDKRIKV